MPTDANFILLTNNSGQFLANALSLCLASLDSQCHIICAPSTAADLLRTKLINPSKLLVISSRGDVNIGIARITMVHANYSNLVVKSGSCIATGASDDIGMVKVASNSMVTKSSDASSALSYSGGAAAGWVI